jgi:mannose-6-phosphate isomerase-like protein (cupin superfamily)
MTIATGSFDKPDNERDFPNGHAAFVDVGDHTVARTTMQPGWKWSNDIKPIAKTDSCQMLHTGVVLSGHLRVEHNDGSAADLKVGDTYVVEPGHDAWVVGNEPFSSVDWAPRVGDFAKPAK